MSDQNDFQAKLKRDVSPLDHARIADAYLMKFGERLLQTNSNSQLGEVSGGDEVIQMGSIMIAHDSSKMLRLTDTSPVGAPGNGELISIQQPDVRVISTTQLAKIHGSSTMTAIEQGSKSSHNEFYESRTMLNQFSTIVNKSENREDNS